MTPGDEEIRLAKRIVESYRASGVTAKVYRGGIFVEREAGWDGPYDSHEIQGIYLDEIEQIERSVRAVVAETFARMIEAPEGDLPLVMWKCLHLDGEPSVEDRRQYFEHFGMSEEAFVKSGMSESKARLVVRVAHSLSFRRILWP